MSNYDECFEYVNEYADPEKEISNFWAEAYSRIESTVVVSRVFDVAVVLENNESANTFCQRATSDLLNRNFVIDGRLEPELINETTNRGLERQLALSTIHYAANYVQNRVRSREYGKYLRRFFR